MHFCVDTHRGRGYLFLLCVDVDVWKDCPIALLNNAIAFTSNDIVYLSILAFMGGIQSEEATVNENIE